ncbi:hypothetical protein [Campylobacter gastrosuis]|uniref:Uncharacterized protein n=1 Tax=Campylobacter gastrosuis TaxID=2974576 RepID=A0ABT7HSI3_9BACT|nr:hypothetical protein [Campylobacter gastrosuis]MDL0089378.1 hypothetical protein [Campylobacter gastrosuis]
MQILGHDLIAYEPLIFTKDEIYENCFFEFDKALIKKAKEQNAQFSVVCDDLTKAILANASGAKFIICDIKNAKNFAKMAEFYLFDSKIACVIDDEAEIAILAYLGVDVAIFREAIRGDF